MTTVNIQPDATAGLDTYINAGAQTTNYGTNIGMNASGPASTQKSLIQFDLSSIPTDATINSATLRLHAVVGSGSTVTIHRGLVAWVESQATWQQRATSTAWIGGFGGAAGSDYSSSSSDSNVISSISDWDFDVTADVADIVNSAGNNYGWWLLQASGTTSGFHTSDYGTAGDRPELIIDYTPAVDPDISGTAAGTSSATADMVGYGSLSGTAAGTSSATADIASNLLQGSADGSSTATGDLGAYVAASGEADGTSTVTGHIVGDADISGSAAGSSTVTGEGELFGNMSGVAAGTSTVTGNAWAFAIHVRAVEVCDPLPLFYITDGTYQDNGQQSLLNLIDPRNGFVLYDWNPTVAQYKEGGVYSDSPFANGRRLVRRVFSNAIEVLDMKVRSHNPNLMIQFIRELFAWQEAAADYWTSDYGVMPVYIAARAARESYTRYAIIHTISVPELANPYSQPFVMRDGKSAIESLTIRIERGDWWDTPPGEYECIPVSAQRSWTVAGWVEGGS